MDRSQKPPGSDELARAAQQGDQRALAALVELHKHAAYRVALRLAGNPHDAEEILQNALERVLRHLHRYDAQRPFKPWLMQIVVNQARTLLRRRKLLALFYLGGNEPAAGGSAPYKAELQIERREMRRHLEAAVRALPLAQREAFVLKHIEGMSYEEIAQVTGDSVGSLKVRTHRARRALVQWLAGRGVTLGVGGA